MTREEAIHIIEKEIHIDVRCCTHADACRFEDALRMAISALREQEELQERLDAALGASRMWCRKYHERITEPRWISVAERLPEQGTVALVWDGTFRKVARLGKWGWHEEYLPDDENGGRFVDGVAHWMPLPESPEVEV